MVALRAFTRGATNLALVKELRARTAAPMKKCVEALAASADDVEGAVAWLRKSGVASAAKKAGRGANEGAVAVAATDRELAVIELNSETDFVARNTVFQELARGVVRSALALGAAEAAAGPAPRDLDLGALGRAPLAADGGGGGGSGAPPVAEAVGVAAGTLGENLVLRRACVLRLADGAPGLIARYVHNAYADGVGRTAAAVALQSEAADADALRRLGEQLAMHVVAAAPLYLERDGVSAEHLEREREILVQRARASGKPDPIVEKMVQGQLTKFYQEVVLLDQPYVVDPEAGAVRKMLAAASKELGAEVALGGFVRYHVGQGEV
jgi:elongation factor Ts